MQFGLDGGDNVLGDARDNGTSYHIDTVFGLISYRSGGAAQWGR
jgi:hypothetical protein